MTTSVELSRAAEFQWSSRARGTERSLKGGAAETSAARDLRTSHQGTESCDKRTQRGQRGTSEISAERDQWRRPPDERHHRATSASSGSARRVRTEADQSSGEAPEGRARAERAKLRVTPGTSGAKEFEDGRKRQAALRRSCLLRH